MPRTDDAFKQVQYEFTAHVRDPEHQPVPDNIENRRMSIYRDLIFNNINDTLQKAFPVIRSLYDETAWRAMVRDFIIKHQCKTPLFVEIAREFINYLNDERVNDTDPPFLQELAHYEWVELALSIAEDDFTATPLTANEDSLSLKLTQSPLAWLFVYQYPVHQISVENQPQQPAEIPACLLVQRIQEDDIKFIELNPLSARLLELVAGGMTGYEAVNEVVTAMQHPNPEVVQNGARQMITDWLDRGILLKQQA